MSYQKGDVRLSKAPRESLLGSKGIKINELLLEGQKSMGLDPGLLLSN